MSMDGWTTAQGIPVVGVAVQNHLVDAMETIGEAHTTDFLLGIAEKALVNIETEMKVKVVAMVTDTASNMASMRTQLEAKHPESMHINSSFLIISFVILQSCNTVANAIS